MGALEGAKLVVGAGVPFGAVGAGVAFLVGEAEGGTVTSELRKQKSHVTGHASLTLVPLFEERSGQNLLILFSFSLSQAQVPEGTLGALLLK